MYISSVSLLVFVVVLIILELVAKDTNVLVVCWVLIWSVGMYLMNQPQVAEFFNSCSCQRPTPKPQNQSSDQQNQQSTAPPPPTQDLAFVDYSQTQPLL